MNPHPPAADGSKHTDSQRSDVHLTFTADREVHQQSSTKKQLNVRAEPSDEANETQRQRACSHALHTCQKNVAGHICGVFFGCHLQAGTFFLSFPFFLSFFGFP